MRKTDEDRVSRQNPQFAAMDRQRRNKENAQLFSVTDQFAATAFSNAVDVAYFRRNVYLNFNEKNIVVKVNRPANIDKLDPLVRELDATTSSMDVVIKDLPNGNRIYELPFEPE